MMHCTHHTLTLDADTCCLTNEWSDVDPNSEVEIHYYFTPGTPDVFYLPNGDPGYPGEPEEFEIAEIWMNGRNIFELISDETLDHINVVVNEMHEEEEEDYED